MKRFLLQLPLVLFIFAAIVSAQAPDPNANIVKKPLSQAEIDRIIKNFTTKEGEFRDSLRDYVFNRDATVQTVGIGGNITGEFRRVSFMTFNSDNSRFEQIKFAPISTLTDLTITPEDLEDLGGINPFALDPSVINLYNINYIGKEKVDELDLYVFDVSPKVMPDPKKTKQRLFTGRVWVDDRDLQIVKSKGKAVPETKQNKFPIVETWRENVDGKFWFPSYSYANDELVFDNGQVAHVKMKVKYSDYKLGRTDVRVLDDDTSSSAPATKKP